MPQKSSFGDPPDPPVAATGASSFGDPPDTPLVHGMEKLGGTPPGPPKPPNPITFQRSPLGQGNAIAYEAKTGMPPREEEFTRGMNEIPPVMYLPPSIAAATTGPGAFAVSSGVGYGASKGARALGASPVVSDVLGALAGMGTGMAYARMLPGIFPRNLSEPTKNFLNMLPGKNYGDAANKFLESVHPAPPVLPRNDPDPYALPSWMKSGASGETLPPPPASTPTPAASAPASGSAAPLKLTPPPGSFTQGSLTAGFSTRTLQKMQELGITESDLADPKIAQQVKQLDISIRRSLQKPPK